MPILLEAPQGLEERLGVFRLVTRRQKLPGPVEQRAVPHGILFPIGMAPVGWKV